MVQHHAPPYLSTALQVAQRCARLVGRPSFYWYRRHLAGLDEGKQLSQIIKGADVGALDRHHLEREQHRRDRVGAAIESDHDELAALAQDVDAELHRPR